ncbi:hypothetical protein J4711_13505 [Staphylococcus epidermidis]|nr:hypothetical protein [Staphylococcus epidermidis]
MLALVAPWFSDDGITLEYLRADLWLARGTAFKDLATASMDRALGRDVRPWIPDPIQGAIIQRLQTELQMLLLHQSLQRPARERRLPPINSFWVHGTGSLPSIPATPAQAACIDDLRHTTLQGDVQGWQKAWRELDSSLIASLQQRAARGEPIKLTLCGERNAVQWESQPRGLMDKSRVFEPNACLICAKCYENYSKKHSDDSVSALLQAQVHPAGAALCRTRRLLHR